MKTYKFTCGKLNTFEVERYRYQFKNDEQAEVFALFISKYYKYDNVLIEEIREVAEIFGGKR